MFKKLFSKPIDDTKSKVNEYVNLRLKEAKLTAVEKGAPILGKLLVAFLVLLFSIGLFLFASIAFSIWIGTLINSTIGGFLITGGLFLLLIIIVLLSTKAIIRKIGDAFLKNY